MFGSMMFPIFLGITVLLFFLLPIKCRPAVLLFSSYFFCGFISLQALAVLIVVSVWVWAEGIWIEHLGKKGKNNHSRAAAISAVGICILVLAIFKYGNSVISRVGLEGVLGERILSGLIMPVGLSFYLFQAIGYLADIATGKSHAEKNFFYLGCFLAFFPKLVSGPIEREGDFIPQMKKFGEVKFWDRGRLSTAFTYMLWGYFMKMVVADRLAIQVNILFDRMQEFDSFWLVMGALFYTIQIYCDFAGYSYIAIGCAQIFGIQLTQNFKAPYQAASITEFWRKWHVSLSGWLRDYLYIPLGGSRKGFGRKCVNTMIVFLVCGMWHGAGMHFVAWGILHGLYSVADSIIRRKGWKIPAGRFITFTEVAVAWIFFRAESLRQALRYIYYMATAGIHPEQMKNMQEMLGLDMPEMIIVGFGIILVWLADELCNRKQMHFPFLIQQRKNTVRYTIFYLLLIAIFIFGVYGSGYHTEQFIYMQF